MYGVTQALAPCLFIAMCWFGPCAVAGGTGAGVVLSGLGGGGLGCSSL